MKPVASLFALLALTQVASASLNMFFTNQSSYGNENVWITLQRGAAPTTPPTGANIPGVSYGTNAFVWNTYANVVTNYVNNGGTITTNYQTNIGNVYSESVRLSDILDAGGLTWTSNAASVGIYVSYGTNMPVSLYSLSGASPSASSDPSYYIPYQNFEITYTGNPGDQGDLTAINWFTAPMSISSYASSDATGTVLQHSGFNAPTSTIFQQLQELTANAPANAPIAVVTNSAGQAIRVIGPSQYGAGNPGASDYGPYPSFTNYFAAMEAQTNRTVLSNSSGFNSIPTPDGSVPYTNASVAFVLTNQVTYTSNGYQLQAVGDIITTYVSYTTLNTNNNLYIPSATNVVTNSGVVFTVTPGEGANALTNVASAFVYYGSSGTYPDNIFVGGSGWTNFVSDISGYVNAAGVGGASVIGAQIPGELATAFATGLVGSTNTVAQYGDIPLGELPSGMWWNMTNVILFSDLQGTNGFYNVWGDVIYQNSSNSVYGLVYSDRFNFATSLINTVQYGTNAVGSWLVSLGEPISVPEPAAAVMLIGALIAFAVFKTLRKPRRKGLSS